jgi:hypothetical protein
MRAVKEGKNRGWQTINKGKFTLIKYFYSSYLRALVHKRFSLPVIRVQQAHSTRY